MTQPGDPLYHPKIIQIATTFHPETFEQIILALSDDGYIWKLETVWDMGTKTRWQIVDFPFHI
jgi:hypothetical protein